MADDERQLKDLIASKRAALGIDVDAGRTPPPLPTGPLAASVGARVAIHGQDDDEAGDLIHAMRVPSSPDLKVVDILHRRHDGYIPFTARDGDGRNGWRELGCVKANKLPTLFVDEAFDVAVDTDSYFGLHGMFAPAHSRRRSTLDCLLPSLRQAKHVRWLTCCHVDLDTYRVGIDAEDGVATILRAARQGVLPPPSMFLLSRGCWVWWLLHDEKGEGPVNSWPENQRLWDAAQGELNRRTVALGSDRAALHAATVTRIPGSYSTKARRRVAYMPCLDVDGKLVTYTLPELFNALGTTPPPPKPYVVDARQAAPAAPKDPSRVERGKVGYTGRWNRFLEVMERLRTMRGGWRVGCRSKAIFLLAVALKAKGLSGRPAREAMENALVGMAQPTGDRITLDDALKVLKGVGKPKRGGVAWQTVADDLDISPEESAHLSKRGSFIPPARRWDRLPPATAIPPEERTRRRREAVAAIVARVGAVPTAGQLRELLVAEGHDPPAPTTLLHDLEVLGHPSPRKKPRKAPDDRQTTLLLEDPPQG